MKKLLLFLTLVGSVYYSHAQLSKGGRPQGWLFAGDWNEVPMHTMPYVDVATLLAQDSIADPEMKKPIRFGKAAVISISPALGTGIWRTLPNGHLLWQQRIKSSGAYSLSLGFRSVHLPKGSRLFIYNKEHSTVLGAFTNELPYVDNVLATEQINGDEALVEYEVLPGDAAIVPFEIYRISHDYRDINKILKSFGDAGTCQVNINCPAAVNHQDVKRSVAAIISSGVELCTGTLVTTTTNSGVPYFLTANHCYDNNEANWVFRFNWESPTCTNPSTSPTFQSISGSTLRARNAGTDFCLVQLSTTPPASYNVVYAGWDKTGNGPTSQVCISHPSIDIKKFCNTAQIATTATYGSATCWKTGIWSNGCPEPGSSGSALFDQNKRVVGQLFGGPSACGASTSNMYDYYGKFSVSWNGSGTSATRLKDWLDPTNTNLDTTNTFNPNTPVLPYDARMNTIVSPQVASYCAGSIVPSVTVANNGTTTLTSLTVGYRLDNGPVVPFAWTGSLVTGAVATIPLAVISASTAGTHTFQAFTSLPNGQPDGNVLNDTLVSTFTIVATTPQAVPFTEDFSSATFPPTPWTVGNPDNGYTWERSSASVSGNGSAFRNNWDDNSAGDLDYLISPFLDFSSTTANYNLKFKVAYQAYSTSADSLLVEVSTDCGNSWVNVYRKGGSGLASVTGMPATPFTPTTAAQWRQDSISLVAYQNTPSVRIRFVAYNGYGNNIYLDDINISAGIPLSASFTTQPSTICAGQSVSINNTTTGGVSYSWTMPGGNPASSTTASPVITYNTAGTYIVALTATGQTGTQTVTQNVTVHPLPVPVITASGFVLSTTPSFTNYQWFMDGIMIPGATAPSMTATANGIYTVQVTDPNSCTATSAPVTVRGVGVDEIGKHSRIIIRPNPAHDYIEISESISGNEEIKVSVYNMLGQVVLPAISTQQKLLRVDVSKLANGVYMLHLSKGTTTIVRKLTIE